MAEIGVLSRDARMELLVGEIIDLPSSSPFHAGLVGALVRLFIELSHKRWSVRSRNPLRLDNYSEPEPDVMLLRPSPDDYTRKHPGPEDVFLLIEVADSTLEKDRAVKLPIYGHAGVAEVWIVNLNDTTIEIYREPHYTGYANKTVIGPGGLAAPLAFPEAVINATELFKR